MGEMGSRWTDISIRGVENPEEAKAPEDEIQKGSGKIQESKEIELKNEKGYGSDISGETFHLGILQPEEQSERESIQLGKTDQKQTENINGHG